MGACGVGGGDGLGRGTIAGKRDFIDSQRKWGRWGQCPWRFGILGRDYHMVYYVRGVTGSKCDGRRKNVQI